jgi:hypothetical protein
MLTKLQIPVALCSGNHDLPGNHPILLPGTSIRKDKLAILGEYAKHNRWLRALKMNHFVAVDGDSKIIRTKSGESISVVCVPYAADGCILPVQAAADPCLVLHHEPPAETSLADPKAGNREFALVIIRQQPAWTLSGHVHFTKGTADNFAYQIGKTWCFNCQQVPPKKLPPSAPNYIVLDTTNREASWIYWGDGETSHKVKIAV